MRKNTKRERDEAIKYYAEHFHSPISDFSGFNKTLKDSTGISTTKKKVGELLGYIVKEKRMRVKA